MKKKDHYQKKNTHINSLKIQNMTNINLFINIYFLLIFLCIKLNLIVYFLSTYCLKQRYQANKIIIALHNN